MCVAHDKADNCIWALAPNVGLFIKIDLVNLINLILFYKHLTSIKQSLEGSVSLLIGDIRHTLITLLPFSLFSIIPTASSFALPEQASPFFPLVLVFTILISHYYLPQHKSFLFCCPSDIHTDTHMYIHTYDICRSKSNGTSKFSSCFIPS